MGYTYVIRFDSPTDPRKATLDMYPFGLNVGSMPTFGAAFHFDFVEGGRLEFPGSVVWHRGNSISGTMTKAGSTEEWLLGRPYDVVQVIDENGDKIEPAFDAWVRHMKYTVRSDSIWYCDNSASAATFTYSYEDTYNTTYEDTTYSYQA